MKVPKVRKPENLSRARHEMPTSSIIANLTGEVPVLEYKDPDGGIWQASMTRLAVDDVPQALKNKLMPVRYAVARMTGHGYAMLHGPFLKVEDAMDCELLVQDNDVILKLKGDVSEVETHVWNADLGRWQALKTKKVA